MSAQKTIQGRYEIKAIIGRGGMGVVYRAYDPVMKREVAVKTLHDISSQPVLELFYRECSILKGIVHPNVIDILDMGDFEDEGVIKPYYVMPLLPGKTLYDLLHPSRDVVEPLSVDRAVEIIVQTSRGLHAAHERELLHRDVKPRNIFVIDEYSVKLIDFGVAHLLGSNSTTGVKGTLEYMSPEQLKMKPLSRRTDIFSLATVCYEILTGVQPFRRPTEGETAAAVVNAHPVLAFELNPHVPKPISQVISKGMAKEPLSRFATVADFADALQRARRNESLTDLFDPTEWRVRLQRAVVSFEQGDYQFASEVLRDLESEGQAEPEIRELRRQVDEALHRQATSSLYEAADRYFRTEEYSLALRKVQEILEVDAHHAAALALKKKIDEVLAERRVAELIHLASEHLQRAAFTEARKTLQDAQRLRPEDSRIRTLLVEVDSRQKEVLKQRQEQERLYQSSQAAWVQRDISQALMSLERLSELVRQTSDPHDRVIEYKDFYKVVRSEHDALLAALDQAKQVLAAGDFNTALALCAQYLGKYPRHAGFAQLKSEIERQRHEQQIAFRAEVDRRLHAESNLDRQIQILEEARVAYPQESYYANQSRRLRELQVEVAFVIDAAQLAEDAGSFDEALTQWAKLRSIHSQYPGLDEQVARVTSSRDNALAAAKARWAGDIERALDGGDLEQTASLLTSALDQFPGEFGQLQERLDQARQRKAAAAKLLSQANSSASAGRHGEAIELFKRASRTDPQDANFRQSVIQALVEHGQHSVELEWQVAEQYLEGALAIDPSFPALHDIRLRIEQRRQAEFVEAVLARSAEFEKKGEFKLALSEIEAGLARCPDAQPLREQGAAVQAMQAEFELRLARQEALRRVRELERRAEHNLRDPEIRQIQNEVSELAGLHPGDPELAATAAAVGQRLQDLLAARAMVAEGDLEGARALAAKYLSESPQHTGFLDVEAQAAERELQLAIEYMDQVNAQLFAQPDLDGRVEILEEALRRYPSEPHYREQLDLVLAEQNLVRSTAQEAAALEQAGRFEDALEQWQRLRAINRSYPDLDAHIARVSQLQQQALHDAEARWTAQIEKALDEWDFPQALELLGKAHTEFPGKFGSLQERAKQGAERRLAARRVIAEAQESSRKTRWEESRTKLQEALALASGDPVIEKQIAAECAKYARAAIKSNWKVADALLQDCSSLDPSFTPPADLRTKIEEKRQSEFVDQALSQSKQLREAGELQTALDTITAGLNVYSGDPRLSREKAAIDLELRKVATEQQRRRALEELREMESVTRTVAINPVELNRILDRARDIARDHSKDAELYSFSETLRAQVEALQRAQEHLDAGQIQESEALTDQMLARFPDHAAFQALKQAIQDAKVQAAADYMDEVTRHLREVRDLSQGEALLVEAVGKYPGEPYYQQELEFLREKQQLVAEIVKGAREAEQAGRFDEALDLWNRLQTVHRYHPGLDDEIDRVSAILADKQSAARNRALAEASQAIDARNFRQASELLRKIRAEFGKAAAEECARLQAQLDATVASLRLASEGRAFFADGKHAEGSERFVAAARKVPEDRQLVDTLVDELIKRATVTVDADWRRAGPLIQALQDIDSKHPDLAGLRARAESGKREEALAGLLNEFRALRDAGDLRSAEKKALAALETYPGEPRLTKCLTEIRAAIAEEARVQRRQQAFAELTSLQNEVQAASPKRLKKALKEGLKQADAIVAKAGSDPEVRERANVLKASFAERMADKQPVSTIEQPSVPPQASPEESPAPADSNRRRIWVGAGIAAGLVLGSIIILRLLHSGNQVAVSFTSEVAGASVTVGANSCVTPNCTLNLPAGNYTVTAKKDGFKTATQVFTVSPGQTELKLPVTLEPLVQVLEVNTNFGDGRVLLDGRFLGDLRDGRYVLQGVAPGPHSIEVSNKEADFRAEWRGSIGERPVVLSNTVAKDLKATLVTSMGESTAITCNCGVQNVMVDGVEAGQTAETPAPAAPLKNLKEGSHDVVIADRNLVVDVRANPAVRFFLTLDRNVGTVLVETGVEDATIYLNKQAHRPNADGGTLSLPLEVGQYTVRAEKRGYKYRDQPPGPIEVKKGESVRVSAILVPVPAVLDIVGAAAGAQVRVDGVSVGSTDGNGSLHTDVQVQPGDHIVEITKDEYTPVKLTLPFGPGRPTRPDPRQVAMNRVVKPPTPADPAQLEAQNEARDWQAIQASNNPSDFDDFQRKHPRGPHVGDAQNKAAQLRQQQADNAARQADQTAWDSTDKTKRASLQDYITRFRNGAHVQEAQGLISAMDNQVADLASAAKRAKDQADAAEQEKNRIRTAEIQSINGVIKAFETAYNGKDLQTLEKIWIGMPAPTKKILSEQFRDAKTLAFQLSPIGQPVVSGNSASWSCSRALTVTMKSGGQPMQTSGERVTVTLDRSGSSWVIRSIN